MGVQSERLGCSNALLWKLALANVVRGDSTKWFPATDRLVNGRDLCDIEAALVHHGIPEGVIGEYMQTLRERIDTPRKFAQRPNPLPVISYDCWAELAV